MRKHTRIFLKSRGYSTVDFIPCDICYETAVDVHHIDNRKLGGSKLLDIPENLIALCRKHHLEVHESKISKKFLKEIIKRKLNK